MTRCSGLTADTLITDLPRLPVSSFSPPLGEKASLTGASTFGLPDSLGDGVEAQLVLDQLGLDGIAGEPVAPDGLDVVVQVPALEQLADQEAHAAGGVEMVHVGDAVGIDARQQRHDFAEIGHVLPGDLQARRGGDGDRGACVWLVEPPVACSPTRPLTMVFSPK